MTETAGASVPTEVDRSLLEEAGRLLDDTVALRRRIHAHPEVGNELPTTQQTILEALDGLGLQVATGEAVSSVVAVLDGDEPGPTTLLRGDMDALPMPEDTGLDFASEIDGRMHACGHDTHVAMLVGAARLLRQRRAQLRGRVVFMFQPGEEGHGGAKIMLDEGLLDRHGPIDRAFAIHAIANLPSGLVTTRGGTLMASADEFRVTVTGRGGHASMPHDAVDPVPVACEIVTALQAMMTRRIPAFDPAVLTVTRIQTGTAFNVIPEVAYCDGTVRAVSDASRDRVVEGLREVASHIAAAHRCTAEVDLVDNGYPVTVNDAAAATRTLGVATALLGERHVLAMPTPVMGAEDWSYVLQRVPGSMAFLGVARADDPDPAPNHSNRMLVDEPAMAHGVALHAAMALS
ncbi:amidohydrolase [Acidimicrobiaceae bacterium USS-CC1]|uniref:Amidohydrolase n=1 Tax=Acidiferrimicrobium australe TaxID=2664430 RepID=A0ABW9QT83_9ACTN|nr:amidohydrolase [Acidiferrimicrobium australe]